MSHLMWQRNIPSFGIREMSGASVLGNKLQGKEITAERTFVSFSANRTKFLTQTVLSLSKYHQ